MLAAATARVIRFSANAGDCGTVKGIAFGGCTPYTTYTSMCPTLVSSFVHHVACLSTSLIAGCWR